jgi:threonine/homoserine/homoserine lactone efflux protein
MTFDTWLYYTVAILVLTASPGPSVFLCLTKSVTEGFSASVYTALGSLTAIMGVLTLSFTGLGVVIASSEFLFNIIKWTGAAYLIYLGYKAITSKEVSFKLSGEEANVNNSSKLSLFMSGFVVGASNPKAIVFFTALFPQFINIDKTLFEQYLIFLLTFAVMEMSWLLIYAYFGSKSSIWLSRNGRAKMFNRITGGIFIGAGLLLSTSNRT